MTPCPHCAGLEKEQSKNCPYCINGFLEENENQDNNNQFKWIIWTVVIALIGYGIFNSLDDHLIEKNNQILEKIDKTETTTMDAETLEESAKKANLDETKLSLYKNTAYAYFSSGDNDKAMTNFQQALNLAKAGTSDFFLITGEIAYLNGNAEEALSNYERAYALGPENDQINSTLAYFFLGMDDITDSYMNPEKALQYAKKANELRSDEGTIEYLAMAYIELENCDEAIPLLKETSLENKGMNNYLLGICYSSKLDFGSAITSFKKAEELGIELEPEFKELIEMDWESAE
ncbi:MAG: hypothetical protein Q8O95_00025 [bacterium]|nr:hypothetical protein [bacterium]